MTGSPDPTGWEASKDEFLEVEVDPFEPESVSSRIRATRLGWSDLDDDGTDDWYPIILIMVFGGLLLVLGLLTNAIPSVTTSVEI